MNIFLTFILGSILVFTSVSIEKGKFDLNLLNNSINRNVAEFDNNNLLESSNINGLNSVDSITEKKANQTNYYVPIHVSNILVVKFFVTRERTKFFDQKN